MDKKTVALKLALEGAANYIDALGGDSRKYRQALAEQPAQQEDPCPGCRKGGVCRTPKCGRLKLPADHPYRTEQPAQPKGCQCPACKVTPHASDCAVHNEPAYPKGACNCGAQPEQSRAERMRDAGYTRRPTLREIASEDKHPEQEPVGYFKLGGFNVWWQVSRADSDIQGVVPLYTTPPQRKPLTPREIELLEGMIEVQLHHAAQCDLIANRVMADKQKGWDMERVELLRKLKEKNT